MEWLVDLNADEFLVQERALGQEMAAVHALLRACFPIAEHTYLTGPSVDAYDKELLWRLPKRAGGLP